MPPENDNEQKLSLEAIAAPDIVPDTADSKTVEESEELDDYRDQRKILELQELKQNIDQRKIYAKRIFALACTWLTCILLISILQGLGARGGIVFYLNGWPIRFGLSDNVLIALIATTTANIIGVLVVIVKYLFPRGR